MTLSLGEVEQAVAGYYAAFEQNGCEQTTALCRFAANDLSGEERAAFTAHLEACSECRGELQWLGEMETTWRDGLARTGSAPTTVIKINARPATRPATLDLCLTPMVVAFQTYCTARLVPRFAIIQQQRQGVNTGRFCRHGCRGAATGSC